MTKPKEFTVYKKKWRIMSISILVDKCVICDTYKPCVFVEHDDMEHYNDIAICSDCIDKSMAEFDNLLE